MVDNVITYISTFKTSIFGEPPLTPKSFAKPTFDPLHGLEGRQERVMIATEAEMRSAKLPLKDRDYCAHLLIKYRTCRKDNWPFPVMCSHERHTYLNCQHEDFILRMKEYERERRLLVRQQEELDLQFKEDQE